MAFITPQNAGKCACVVSEWVRDWLSDSMSEWVIEWLSSWVSEWVSEEVSESVSETEWLTDWLTGPWVSLSVSEYVPLSPYTCIGILRVRSHTRRYARSKNVYWSCQRTVTCSRDCWSCDHERQQIYRNTAKPSVEQMISSTSGPAKTGACFFFFNLFDSRVTHLGWEATLVNHLAPTVQHHLPSVGLCRKLFWFLPFMIRLILTTPKLESVERRDNSWFLGN